MPDFEAMYTRSLPAWDIGRPQPAFQALADGGALRGRVLDVGCGTGEHALMAAGLGLDATGIDMAPSAIATAQGKARERGLNVRFLVGDALKLSTLGERRGSTCLRPPPGRISRKAELRAAFADGWDIESIQPASIVVNAQPDGMHAWLAGIRRSGGAAIDG